MKLKNRNIFNEKYIFIMIVILLVFCISIGFAYLETRLSISGSVSVAVEDDSNVTILGKKMIALSDKGIDIKNSGQSGLFYIYNSKKELGTPIYYFRGNVDNNNVLFANYCWKIVRTTEKGGTKLLYNGVPSSGKCNNSGTVSQIGVSSFNSESDVFDENNSDFGFGLFGYMYKPIAYLHAKLENFSGSLVYGKKFEISGGNVILQDTIKGVNASIYSKIASEGYYYTCNSVSNTCTKDELRFIYYISSTEQIFIGLYGGVTVDVAFNNMFPNDSSINEKDSTIKKTIDSWYKSNLLSYTNMLEDTVWCNDRSVVLNNFQSTPSNILDVNSLTFGYYGRHESESLFSDSKSLLCKNNNDSFTVSDSEGNGKLVYPVGLLTGEEMRLSTAKTDNNFLDSGEFWYSMTPISWSVDLENRSIDLCTLVSWDGDIYCLNSIGEAGVRPSIVLRQGVVSISGDGTVSNPYVVK